MALAITTLVACGGDEQNTVRVAAVYGVNGAEASPTWKEVLELATDDANSALAAAGEDRYRFELVFSDTGNDTEMVGPQKADEAVADGALAIIGSATVDSEQISHALNYDSTPIGVPVICANCGAARLNDADREDDDPELQATYRDEQEWMFRTLPDHDDIPILVDDMSIGQCAPHGDCNGDGVLKLTLFSSNEGAGFVGDVQDYVAEEVQPRFDADPACVAGDGPCVRVIVENVEYDRDAVPETYDYSELVANMMDSDNDNSEKGVPMPDPTDQFPPDFMIGQALATFEGGITIELVEQGADLSRVPRRRNFRQSVVLQIAGEAAEGSFGVSPVVAADNASGAYLLEAREALSIADSNFYDAAVLVYLAMMQAAAELDDPTLMTHAQIRDQLKLVNVKEGSTIIYAGPAELTKAAEAIAAGTPIDYDGASGPVDFSARTTNVEEDDDAGGNVFGNQEEFHVENGAFVPGDLFDCITGDCVRMAR
jgi:hypothetical protein